MTQDPSFPFSHSAQRRAEALQLLAQGQAITAVAAAVGVSVSTLQRWRQAAGDDAVAPAARRRYTPQEKAQAVRLVCEQGFTREGAAALLDIPLKNVARWVEEAGAPSPVERRQAERAALLAGSRSRRKT